MKENWTYKKLGEVCDEAQTYKWGDKEKKYIDLTSVDRETHCITETIVVNKENAPSRAKQLVKIGDVLFGTTRPTMKRVCVIDDLFDEQVCSTGFCLLRPTQSVLPRWIYYNLLSDSFYSYIEPLQNGVAYPAVSNKDVRNYQIPIPPIEVQSRIVSELDLLQSIIDKQQAQLKELDNLGQAVFYDMFSQPKEKGYAIVMLGQIATLKAGYSPSEEDLFDIGSYPYFKVGDMNTEGNQKYLSITKSYANPPKKVFPKDSIVFPKNGAAIGTNKKRILAQDSIVDLNTAILICDKKQVAINYIYSWLLTIDFKDYTRRGAVPTLDAKDLMNTQLPLPPLNIQQDFSEKIETIEKQKETIRKSTVETQKLFDYTMDKYFG